MGKEVEAGARPSSSPSTSSPFAAVGRLLRFYSWVGAFPAGMDETYSKFWVCRACSKDTSLRLIYIFESRFLGRATSW